MKYLQILLSTFVLAFALMATPSTAYAAGCLRNGCDGKWAGAQNCGGHTDLTRYVMLDAQVAFQMRHSNTCRSKWVRIIDDRPCGRVLLRADIQTRHWVRKFQTWAFQRERVAQTVESQCRGRVWSRMLGVDAQERICWGLKGKGNPWWGCTRWQ